MSELPARDPEIFDMLQHEVRRQNEGPLGKTAPESGRLKKMSELCDSDVFPGIQGGPLMHVIASTAVAFGEALQPSFNDYGKTPKYARPGRRILLLSMAASVTLRSRDA